MPNSLENFGNINPEKYNEMLNSLVQENGEPVVEEEMIVVEDKDKIKSAVNKTRNKLAYDDRDIPLPGQEMNIDMFRNLTNSDKETGIKRLITEAALLKAEEEQAEEARRAKARNIAEQRADILKTIMYQQEQEYFKKNKCMMSGQQKRKLKRIIERNFEKGMYDKYIIDESGIPLN